MVFFGGVYAKPSLFAAIPQKNTASEKPKR